MQPVPASLPPNKYVRVSFTDHVMQGEINSFAEGDRLDGPVTLLRAPGVMTMGPEADHFNWSIPRLRPTGLRPHPQPQMMPEGVLCKAPDQPTASLTSPTSSSWSK